MLNIYAEVKCIKYQPLLCRNLKEYDITQIDEALLTDASFLIKIGNERLAVSWWVSPKRTRSYPYARVYDTLKHQGKKLTIIPVIKDEGIEGDRDFLQWDTISLMSLLNVYTIISYYIDAEKSPRFENKITNQKFDTEQIVSEIKRLLSYHSDALHWNMEQLDKVHDLALKALENYKKISEKLKVTMHSEIKALERIEKVLSEKKNFLEYSRDLAKHAQRREIQTVQPKEKVSGIKATITIKNYLGGYYYFTCDEVEIEDEKVYLIEAKHSDKKMLPSLNDIKDGLLKLIIYCNLENVRIKEKLYEPIPVLKLTNKDVSFSNKDLRKSKELCKLIEEAKCNRFRVKINDYFIV